MLGNTMMYCILIILLKLKIHVTIATIGILNIIKYFKIIQSCYNLILYIQKF